MYALYEEAGKFQTGRLMSEAETSAQVELETGKRVKVKLVQVLLRFDKPAPAALLGAAAQLATDIELPLAWEFAPDDEFGFIDLARDYFQDPPTLEQQAAALLCLHEAPHYFRRAGKGRFRKAAAEVVQQALAAIEKKARIQAEIDAWAQDLVAGRCPAPVREQLYRILFKPDKNAPTYKAVVQAARDAQRAPLDLLLAAGAIESPYQFHWQRFLFEQFPKGTGFGALDLASAAPPIDEGTLPLADVQAYSIDDSQTTEIDDALSVTGLGTGQVTLGIHIAAPALAIAPGGALDIVARDRLSTVYMPGHKITMLPDDVVQRYTLAEGRACPAVSLYVSFDEATLELRGHRSAIERVPIAANLRHDRLDAVVTEAWLENSDSNDLLIETGLQRASVGHSLLSFLYRLAKHLKLGREAVRGRPELFTRPDFNYRLEGVPEAGPPTGNEVVRIDERRRGAPLDLMVAEAMILANNTWGQMLAEHGVPGIYRSQASLAPGIKVRMGTKALPHAGIGVKAYAWSTSPLRRYVDLVNQWQIVACIRHGKTAALVAPFKPKDAALMAVVSAFDAAYTAYNQWQGSIERFWTLRFVQQNNLHEIPCTVLREGLVRADRLALVLPVMGAQDLPRGTQVNVRLGTIDLMTLDVSGTVAGVLHAAQAAAAGDAGGSEALDEGDDGDVTTAGPIALAVDVSDADAAAEPAAAHAVAPDNPGS